jgi:excisionase family DNA binding protein
VIAVEETYYKVEEIAKRFRVSRQAVYNWIAEGKLKAAKVGSHTRITESAVQDFIKPTTEQEPDEDLERILNERLQRLRGSAENADLWFEVRYFYERPSDTIGSRSRWYTICFCDNRQSAATIADALVRANGWRCQVWSCAPPVPTGDPTPWRLWDEFPR